MRVAPRARSVAVTRAGSARAMTALVARLLDRTIMRSNSSRSGTRSPTRAYRVLSESSAGLTLNGEPSAIDANALTRSTGWSIRMPPRSDWRRSSIITGTFIVLAAWKLESAFRRSPSPPPRGRYTTPTRAGHERDTLTDARREVVRGLGTRGRHG